MSDQFAMYGNSPSYTMVRQIKVALTKEVIHDIFREPYIEAASSRLETSVKFGLNAKFDTGSNSIWLTSKYGDRNKRSTHNK